MRFRAAIQTPPRPPKPPWPFPVTVKVVFFDCEGNEITSYDPAVRLMAGDTVNVMNIGLEVIP